MITEIIPNTPKKELIPIVNKLIGINTFIELNKTLTL